MQNGGCFSAVSGLAPYKPKGWGLFLGADHTGGEDTIKAELALFKVKVVITGKLSTSILMIVEPFV